MGQIGMIGMIPCLDVEVAQRFRPPRHFRVRHDLHFQRQSSLPNPPTHLVCREAHHLEPFKTGRSGESDVGLSFFKDFAEIDLDPVESWRVSQNATERRSREGWGDGFAREKEYRMERIPSQWPKCQLTGTLRLVDRDGPGQDERKLSRVSSDGQTQR